jgi:hypothetical protein
MLNLISLHLVFIIIMIPFDKNVRFKLHKKVVKEIKIYSQTCVQRPPLGLKKVAVVLKWSLF